MPETLIFTSTDRVQHREVGRNNCVVSTSPSSAFCVITAHFGSVLFSGNEALNSSLRLLKAAPVLFAPTSLPDAGPCE